MERFSRMHRGWRVDVGVIDTELMTRSMEAQAHPLGDSALFEDLRLDEQVDGERVAVVLGLENALATHSVRKPRRMIVEVTEHGDEEGLRVDSEEGTSLLLRFHGAVSSETLDGLAPGED